MAVIAVEASTDILIYAVNPDPMTQVTRTELLLLPIEAGIRIVCDVAEPAPKAILWVNPATPVLTAGSKGSKAAIVASYS